VSTTETDDPNVANPFVDVSEQPTLDACEQRPENRDRDAPTERGSSGEVAHAERDNDESDDDAGKEMDVGNNGGEGSGSDERHRSRETEQSTEQCVARCSAEIEQPVLADITEGQDVGSPPIGFREPVGVDGHQWSTHPKTVCATEQPDEKENAETEGFNGQWVEGGIVAAPEYDAHSTTGTDGRLKRNLVQKSNVFDASTCRLAVETPLTEATHETPSAAWGVIEISGDASVPVSRSEKALCQVSSGE